MLKSLAATGIAATMTGISYFILASANDLMSGDGIGAVNNLTATGILAMVLYGIFRFMLPGHAEQLKEQREGFTETLRFERESREHDNTRMVESSEKLSSSLQSLADAVREDRNK